MRGLIHFVGKSGFDIQGLGSKLVERFIEKGMVLEPADFWKLRKEDIAEMERLGEKSAENLITAINEKKEIELPRFLSALGIPNVGWETAHDLAEYFQTLRKLMDARLEEIERISNVGPVVAKSVYDFFNHENAKREIKNLISVGVKVKEFHRQARTGKLSGKSIVITGSLSSISREEARGKIEKLGGKWSDTVSKKTDYLVVGDEPGSKLEKARKLGVEIIEEKEFLKLII